MSDPGERVVPAYQVYFDAASKYDYFVTGGAGAVLAYSLERFVPNALPVAAWLAPVAWALLIASIIGGLAHLDAGVAVLKAGVGKLEATSSSVEIRKGLSEATPASVILINGVRVSHDQALEILGIHERAKGDLTKHVRKYQRRGQVAYHVRNGGLIGGFGALAVWKALNLFLGGP